MKSSILTLFFAVTLLAQQVKTSAVATLVSSPTVHIATAAPSITVDVSYLSGNPTHFMVAGANPSSGSKTLQAGSHHAFRAQGVWPRGTVIGTLTAPADATYQLLQTSAVIPGTPCPPGQVRGATNSDGSVTCGVAGSDSSKIRQIATRSILSDTIWGAGGKGAYMMTRNQHEARNAQGKTITAVKVAVGNFYLNGQSGEIGPGVSKTTTCSIEYPAGTFNQCKFSGATFVAVPTGGLVWSDWITLSTPIPSGAIFWERYYYSIPTCGTGCGPDWNQSADPHTDCTNVSASFISDQTMGGTVTCNIPGYAPFLYAIVGYTSAPAVCIIGDSIAYGGLGQSPPSPLHYNGPFALSLGPYFAYISLANPGETSASFLSSNTRRVALAQYCTTFFSDFGRNDFNYSITPSQLIANQKSIRALLPSANTFYVATVTPQSTSTDNFLTLANQSSASNTGTTRTYNETLRSTWASWSNGVIDIAALTESSISNSSGSAGGSGTGKWKVDPKGVQANYYTCDGTHLSVAAHLLVASSDIINPAMVH